jgi:hypothetical protein
VGRPEDIPVIEAFLRTTPDLSPAILQQARNTLSAIHSRE